MSRAEESSCKGGGPSRPFLYVMVFYCMLFSCDGYNEARKTNKTLDSIDYQLNRQQKSLDRIEQWIKEQHGKAN